MRCINRDNGGNNNKDNDDRDGDGDRLRLMDAMVKAGPCWPLAQGWGQVTNLKRRTNPQKGGSTFEVPSIAIAECEKTRGR